MHDSKKVESEIKSIHIGSKLIKFRYGTFFQIAIVEGESPKFWKMSTGDYLSKKNLSIRAKDEWNADEYKILNENDIKKLKENAISKIEKFDFSKLSNEDLKDVYSVISKSEYTK